MRVKKEYKKTGTCILADVSAQVPVIIDIDKIEKENYEPNKIYKKL